MSDINKTVSTWLIATIGAAILLAVGSCLVGGSSTREDDISETAQQYGVNSPSYQFNIDINNLSYNLPYHTKLCIPDKKQACSGGECEDIEPTVFLAYDEVNKMIYRCDEKPCDGYRVTAIKSGIYTNINPVEPMGFFVKIDNSDNYIETVSLGLDTLTSYGKCY